MAEHWTCTKRTYASKKEAKRVARRVESKPNATNIKVGRMDVYWCDQHDAWHIGHPPMGWRARAS